jgi:hydroxyacylglutathione hydrolase
MADLEIHQIPTRRDNYVWLLREPASGRVAVVDPSDAPPVIAKLDALGWKLDEVLATHHHNDHVGGVPELKDRYGCLVVGPRADHDRIPRIDKDVGDGDVHRFGALEARVFDTPGHTRGHISYWMPGAKALFCGDTLFALGCGRVFEGTMEQMWASLSKYEAVPDDTRVFCAHEYTQANAKFALSVEPGNAALVRRAKSVDAMRAEGKSTVPSLMGEERATNPFLRAKLPEFRRAVGMADASPAEVFGAVRTRKDKF